MSGRPHITEPPTSVSKRQAGPLQRPASFQIPVDLVPTLAVIARRAFPCLQIGLVPPGHFMLHLGANGTATSRQYLKRRQHNHENTAPRKSLLHRPKKSNAHRPWQLAIEHYLPPAIALPASHPVVHAD
jgi:hypothetical protein